MGEGVGKGFPCKGKSIKSYYWDEIQKPKGQLLVAEFKTPSF